MKINPQAVRTIVSHDNCGDGTVSAMLLRDALPHADVRFIQYGTESYRTLRAEEGMLFCDVAPPAERVQEFREAGALVLDHHRTARAVVEAFGQNAVFADEATEPGVSGAVLAYREIWLPLKQEVADPLLVKWAGHLAHLTGIRDTWQNHDPEWAAACEQASLMHFQNNTEWLKHDLTSLSKTWEDQYAWIGRILTERHQKSVTKSVGRAGRYQTAKGTRVVVFNSTAHTSDAVEMLGKEADLVIGFSYEVENGEEKLILSTRSHSTFDCSAFAKSFGGGGHLRAAGLSVPAQSGNPYQTVLELVRQFEATAR